jgi:hypothetical protein
LPDRSPPRRGRTTGNPSTPVSGTAVFVFLSFWAYAPMKEGL